MKSDSGETVSIWMSEPEIPSDGALQDNTTTDVCVVGAGIAGMTTAYLLSREGRKVMVVDDGAIGGGMTGRTTAHLVTALDDRYYELERLHGERGSRLAAESHSAAIDRVEAVVTEEKIDCEFERLNGYLFAPPDDSKKKLQDELEAAHRAGLTDIEMVERAPIADFDTGKCLRFPRQAQFHPLKYLRGLAKAIRRDGGQIFTQTHVDEVHGGDGARIVTVNGQTIKASSIVVATNTPINDRLVIHTKQAPYITYVIAAHIARGSITRALFWDTPDPYHYVRVESVEETDGGYDLLVVGGEDHKTGQADNANERFDSLAKWARERFPMIQNIQTKWSGQVMEPIDGLAFIGRNPLDEDNVYIATGDSGNGMTHGTIAGILLTDLIAGRPSEWETLYEPTRKTLKALPQFASESLNVAMQYADLVTPGEVNSADDIKPGHGAIIRQGLSKLAVYRDDSGAIHERSAVCVHLGCIVAWNSKEKTWDCPCHGSRYDACGKVFQGPANSDLKEVDEEAASAR